MTSYLVEDRQYHDVLNRLLTGENPFAIGNLRFRLEEDKVYLQKDGEERELQPYSTVLKDGSEKFCEYDCGDGKEALLEALVGKGLTAEKAQELVELVYGLLPEWLILPPATVASIAKEHELRHELFEEARGFIEWLNDDGEEDVGNVGNVGDKDFELSKNAFHAAYFPMTELAWNTAFQKANGETKSFSESLQSCGNAIMNFRIEDDRLFVSSDSFEKEKECLKCMDDHVPSRLRGYRFTNGPEDLVASLIQRGMNVSDAKSVAAQVYSYIDDCVGLPAAEIDTLHASLQGLVVMMHAGMLNDANAFSKWIMNSSKA